MTITLSSIQAAAEQLRGHMVRTPSVWSPRLGERMGCELFLKLENLQYTGSFKDRGAFYRMLSLDEASKARGVIAASAGNHAQGVAYRARQLGIPATIVMPAATPFTKVERTEALGATIVLHGESLLEANEHMLELAQAQGLTVIPPYDDVRVIEGQGTIGLEMLEDHPDLDIIVAPIGGGGLMGGIAVAAKALRPEIQLIGVQTEVCPAMVGAIRGEDRPLQTRTLADGIAVKRPGKLTMPLIRDLVDHIVLVPEFQLERAIQLLANQQNLVAEGAGAAGIAAMLEEPERFHGKRVGVVVCGGNIDARLLANVLQRGLRREGRIGRLRIEIPDSPGILGQVTALVGKSGADIIEIAHQRLFSDAPAKSAILELVVETQGRPQFQRLIDSLVRAGFPTDSIS